MTECFYMLHCADHISHILHIFHKYRLLFCTRLYPATSKTSRFKRNFTNTWCSEKKKKKKNSTSVCQPKCPRCCELLRKRPCWSKLDNRENWNMIRKAGLHAKHAYVCLAFQVQEQTCLNMQTFLCRQMSQTGSRGWRDTLKLWLRLLILSSEN